MDSDGSLTRFDNPTLIPRLPLLDGRAQARHDPGVVS
jgi:hypothetical protein